MVSNGIERHEGKEHNALGITARIAEAVVLREVRAVIVVAVFPEVVVEVLGVAVADAEEFMGNSESVVARAGDATGHNEGV